MVPQAVAVSPFSTLPRCTRSRFDCHAYQMPPSPIAAPQPLVIIPGQGDKEPALL
ncbi:uncharacterized protein BDZ99DRAFT_463306 [Mytilinidion resinicola]|uniref:Uncharacterized protein n=1 Tax=Mytilinidion resinicola TaxID=574789 RepID=A0A6A6YNH4_9PEZI|nr:uncharacterized protein BDZ99DRAFT_463306 [Mytilinidion resinicola]KAF2809525.1 hypothetical protein BDZ99DRAFT_463306 [Mytilinidion resinicola]